MKWRTAQNRPVKIKTALMTLVSGRLNKYACKSLIFVHLKLRVRLRLAPAEVVVNALIVFVIDIETWERFAGPARRHRKR